MPNMLETYERHLVHCPAQPPKAPAAPRNALAQIAYAVFGNIFSFWGATIAFLAAYVLVKIYT